MNRTIHFTVFSIIGCLLSFTQVQGQLKPSSPSQNQEDIVLKKNAAQSVFRGDILSEMKRPKKTSSSPTLVIHQSATFDANLLNIEILNKDDGGHANWLKPRTPYLLGKQVEDGVMSWLEQTRSTMGLDNEASFRLRSQSEDGLGGTHFRYDQMHKGIKVYDGEVIVHVEDGQVILQNGKTAPSIKLPTLKGIQITDEQAKAKVISNLANYKVDWNPLASMGVGKDRKQWEGELVYYAHQGKYRLAYAYKVFANLAERYEYLVDAKTGEILAQWSLICKVHGDHVCNHDHGLPPPDGPATASARDLLNVNRNINTYESGNNFFMIDASRDMFRPAVSDIPDEPIGAIWTIDIGGQSPINSNVTFSQINSTNNSWGSTPEGVSAHFNAGKSYEYFKNSHNRNSLSGDGQTIVSIVNVTDENGRSMGNAFYNSLAIWYGNGDSSFFPLGRALDVAGHELTHGVVEQSANLIYQGESGALNESFADIFGAMIDRDDWLIGEDVVRTSAFPSGALRSMSDPHNGAQFGDFGRGWQPKHTNEKFNGQEDNGGVHINSGIPNHAYYLFATAVGKQTAERVYYRALTVYMTRSSEFKELRFAVEKAAEDLYGQNVVTEAGRAFDRVGIDCGAPTTVEEDVDVNAGRDLILVSDPTRSDLILVDLTEGEILINPLSTTDHISKPSITDDGSLIVFVGADKHIHFIDLDWSTYPPQFDEEIVTNNPEWRNAVVSKDGSRFALVSDALDQIITIVDLDREIQNDFELYNPTYTQGIETGDVGYADAMEFDLSGNVLMYDALNEIKSTLGTEEISYWDIGFLEVWNPSADTWALGSIDKLFGSLPENVSIGNPTFSKNSPNVIAFDVLEDNDFFVIGMNIENNDQGLILEDNTVSYPNFSRLDDVIVFDRNVTEQSVGLVQLNQDKISGVSSSVQDLINQSRWGVWFTNGNRALPTSTLDGEEELVQIQVVPNPVTDDQLRISLSGLSTYGTTVARFSILDITGREIMTKNYKSIDLSSVEHIDLPVMSAGTYLIKIDIAGRSFSQIFIKE